MTKKNNNTKVEKLENKLSRLKEHFESHLFNTRIVWLSIPMFILLIYDIYSWINKFPMDSTVFIIGFISSVAVIIIVWCFFAWLIKETSTIDLDEY